MNQRFGAMGGVGGRIFDQLFEMFPPNVKDDPIFGEQLEQLVKACYDRAHKLARESQARVQADRPNPYTFAYGYTHSHGFGPGQNSAFNANDVYGQMFGFRQQQYTAPPPPRQPPVDPKVRVNLRILGLEPGVTKAEIRTKYRQLAAEHHPDHGGDEAKMRDINAAWDFLRTAVV